jgi:hypothetical protein
VRDDRRFGRARGELLQRDLDLRRADILLVEQDLTVQVRSIDLVVVAEADRADTRVRERYFSLAEFFPPETRS